MAPRKRVESFDPGPLGKYLRELRENQGLSQKELSEQSGVGRGQVEGERKEAMKVEIARHFRWDRLAMAVGLLIGVPLALWGFYALGAYVPLRAEWPFNDAPPKVIYWIWATCAGIIKLLGGIVVLGMASLLVKVLIDCGLAVYFWLWGIDDQRR